MSTGDARRAMVAAPTRRPSRPAPLTRDAAPPAVRGYGWLYVVILIVVSVAPSLGRAGSLARFGCAGLVCVALLEVTWSDARRCARRSRPRLSGLAVLSGAGLVAVLIVASSGPVGAPYGAARLLNWLMFAPLAVLVFRRPSVRALGIGAVLVGVVQSVGVLLQMSGLLGGVWGGIIVSGDDYDPRTSRWLMRYTGFVLDPNNLALLMVLAVIALAGVVLTRRGTVRFVALAGIAWCGYVILVSGSRAGIVALPLIAVVFGVLLGRRMVVAGLFVVLIAAYVLVLGDNGVPSGVLGSFSGILSGHDLSLQERLAIWNSYALTPGQYLLGSGFGGYAPMLLGGVGFNVPRSLAVAVTVDNSWLKLFLECGVLGVAAMVGLLGSAVRSIRGSRSTAPAITRACLAAAITVLVWRSVSTDVFDINPFNALLPMLLGAAWALTPRIRAADDVRRADEAAPAGRRRSAGGDRVLVGARRQGTRTPRLHGEHR